MARLETSNGLSDADLQNWIDRQQLHPRNLLAFIERYPTAFPEDSEVGKCMKSIIEVRPNDISTLPVGFTYDSTVNKWDIRKTNHVVFQLEDMIGRPVFHVTEEVSRHAHETYPQDMTDINADVEGIVPEFNKLHYDCTFDIMFIEPDITGTVAVCAWLMTKVVPAEFIGKSGRRSMLGKTDDTPTSMTLQGTVMRSKKILARANEIMKTVMIAPSQTKQEFVEKIAQDVLDSQQFKPSLVSGLVTVNDLGDALELIMPSLSLIIPGADTGDKIIAIELVDAIIDKVYCNWHQLPTQVTPALRTDGTNPYRYYPYATFVDLSSADRKTMTFWYDTQTGALSLNGEGNGEEIQNFFKSITLHVTRGKTIGQLPKANLTFK